MFTASWFTIAKIWKELKCSSTDEWIKIWSVYIHTHIYMEYRSAIKKNEVMPFVAIWMDLEIIILSEVRKKYKYLMISLICMASKIWHKWTYLWNRQTHRHREQTCGCQGGGRAGEGWEFGISRYKLLHIKWINNKVLLYSTGNCSQYLVINHSGKYLKSIYVYNWITLLYSRNRTL